MLTFKVTHINPLGVRHQRKVDAPSNGAAIAWMEQLYGPWQWLCCMRLQGSATA